MRAAFQCFANLVNASVHYDFFSLESGRMDGHIAAYDCLVRRMLPKVHAHFYAEGVQHKMYLVDWLLTLYTKALGLDIAARVWDNYFLVGEVFLWRTALGILRMFRKHIVTLDLGNLVKFLGHLTEVTEAVGMTEGWSEKELFASIAAVQVDKRMFEQLLLQQHAASQAGGGGGGGALE